MDKDGFEFHSDAYNILASITAHQPNPALGFGSNETGSDVLDMIDRYLNIESVPICGSRMMVLVKRYPNETEVSQLVSKIRHLHVAVTFFISTIPSGGYHSETLYSLATKTNGFCAFDSEDQNNTISTGARVVGFIDSVIRPYLIYAANPIVSGSQTVLLPQMIIPKTKYYMVTMTIQDDGPIDVVNTMMLQWKDDIYKTGNELGMRNKTPTEPISWWQGNNIGYWEPFDNIVYNVSVTCNYADTKTRRLQIRFYSEDPYVDHWMPFDD